MDNKMAPKKKYIEKNFGIMFPCIGRRVSLLNSFRKSAAQLKIQAHFIGTDTTELSPALQLCDRSFIVKPFDHPDYIKQVLKIVKQNSVKLLVPTIDLDLKLFAKNKEKFEKLGCCVLISPLKVIEICQDKRQTYKFLAKNGFCTPVTMSAQAALKNKKLKFPRFLKPWDGSASRGTAIVTNRREFEVFAKRIPNCVVQEYIDGVEYTCDVFVDFEQKVRCVVPRKRLQIRSGEVSKSQIVKDSEIMVCAAKAIQAFGAGPGVITLQLIVDKNKKIQIIEINPRFGGGVPLSIKAGANFPKWILQLIVGQKPRIKFDGFKDDLYMLRYDDEVWFEK